MSTGTTSRKFGTFEGVFTPAVLTIFGVILFLRLGWVVGTGGLGGAILIMVIAHLITISYAFSLSSICTNIKVGAGGSYDIIAKSLGPEVGGAIGLPLYFSFTLGAAMYIIGFTEAWQSIFPTQDPRIISSLLLLILIVLSYVSAKLAMKVQFLIMAVIAFAFISFFLGRGEVQPQIVTWGRFANVGFWGAFAIFFPAVTGTEAGAAMSGDLRNPRRSIPIGIMSAIAVTFVLYLLTAIWLARHSSADELVTNTNIMILLARWPWAVIAAIMGATVSSALACLVSGPRTLQALGRHRVAPLSSFFSKTSKTGEPRNAILFTGLIVEISLLLGELDTIAPLLTMFFLITYAMVNIVVAIEQGIGIVSFRPSFRIPKGIPLFGGGAALAAMVLINPVFSVAAIAIIIAVYMFLLKKHLKVRWGDVREALFVSIAEWAAKTAVKFPHHAKSWRPNLLVPIEDPKVWTTLIQFVRDIIYPGGTLRVFHVRVIEKGKKVASTPGKTGSVPAQQKDAVSKDLDRLITPLKEEGLFLTSTSIEDDDFVGGSAIVMQILKGMFFPPNTLFITLSEDSKKDGQLIRLIEHGRMHGLGMILLRQHPKRGFGCKKKVNLWLRQESPNKDLAIIVSIQLVKNWEGALRLLRAVDSEENVKRVITHLYKFRDAARMPSHTEAVVLAGDFEEALDSAPEADINIFGLAETIDPKYLRKVADTLKTSCLFIRDSGAENIFA
ncbi:MAG: Na-K-Cl cotransporter [Gemmatimonadota bacterium]|nr:MAG: Na-K-Cl cotransporter [Gemmatimonadota bacterium]